jgi:hypothetical protein
MSATEMFEKAEVLNCCIEIASAIGAGIFEFTFSDLEETDLYSFKTFT